MAMAIPSTLYAGDTWTWTDSLSDYPATTYTLKYALRGYGLTTTDITAAASGTDHVSTVTAATTGSIGAGTYSWVAVVERTVTGVLQRTTVGSGRVVVQPNLLTATSTTDIRGQYEIAYDAIIAAINTNSASAVASITVNGRTVQYKGLDELVKAEQILRPKMEAEKAASSGTTASKLVRVQFGSA